MIKNELKVGDFVKTINPKDRGRYLYIIAISEHGVSFYKINDSYIWVPFENIKKKKP